MSKQPANDVPSPAQPAKHVDDCEHTWARNAKVGFILFTLYSALYAGFMGLTTFAHEQMARPVLAGVNLAIIYGFGLIGAALLLALVYMVLCHAPARGGDGPSATSGTTRREDGR